jgi:glycosyltransferase involved in cell wall biosynthesis
VDISIITATCRRHKWLKLCCEQIAAQSIRGVTWEHIIIADGPDDQCGKIARKYHARFHALKKNWGRRGAAAKDFGLRMATGRYVVFFDDDNFYDQHALASLYASVQGVDIGVCQTWHRGRIIPPNTSLPLKLTQIDSMCLCVNTELGRRSSWRKSTTNTDWTWLQGMQKFRPRIRITPIVIGEHLV